MNIHDFTGYIKDPYRPVQMKKVDLYDLSVSFPYCSSVHVLYAFLLYSENDLEFNAQLKKTAAYIPNRKKFKELLDGFRIPVSETIPEPILATAIPEEKGPEIKEPVIDIPAPESSFSRNELMDRVKKRLEEIAREKEGTPVSPVDSREEIPESHLMSKAEIIEKFIREDPRISSPRTSFFKPSEFAMKSNIDETDIVSETLARLYLDQGNTAKAKQVYEKLSLLFPEKSSYFAAQIRKIG